MKARLIFASILFLGLSLTGLWASPASAVSGAGFTSVDEAVDGTGHCQNGNPNNNCNIYDGKEFVWLNGGPAANGLGGDGDYFFVVLVPGGQPDDPNDGGPKNLSDDYDAYTNRTFTVSGGEVSAYNGSHDFDATNDPSNPKIRLFPYADTTNPGGVYIMAICSLAKGYPVDPRDCKYDAFKVKENEETSDLVVTKNVDASFDRTYHWDITKEVDKTIIKQVGGNATFNYTIKVHHDDGTDGSWEAHGTITVFNPNNFDVTGVDVTDAIDDPSATCTVDNGTGLTILAGESKDLTYTCTYSAAPVYPDPPNMATNTATATWTQCTVNNECTPTASADFKLQFKFPDDPSDVIDECVTVTDTFDGGQPTTLGTACVGDANPATFTEQRLVPVPQFDCKDHNNTAEFTTNDTGTKGSASAKVTVCGPVKTGALTMGFWQNKNGQGIITASGPKTGTCPLTTWLRQYNPYQDLSPTATCSQAATYVYNVIKAANAGGTAMNAMLKAQMLATALDVYFSDPNLGGNKIAAPAPIGGVKIDLTLICNMIDGSGGVATCSGTYKNVSGAFGGATSLTVSQMLSYAASQSNSGGSVWYNQVKAIQECAKNAFDAINNQVAFKA